MVIGKPRRLRRRRRLPRVDGTTRATRTTLAQQSEYRVTRTAPSLHSKPPSFSLSPLRTRARQIHLCCHVPLAFSCVYEGGGVRYNHYARVIISNTRLCLQFPSPTQMKSAVRVTVRPTYASPPSTSHIFDIAGCSHSWHAQASRQTCRCAPCSTTSTRTARSATAWVNSASPCCRGWWWVGAGTLASWQAC